MSDLPPQLPHGELREILPDVFFVQGQSRPVYGGQQFQFSRNMVVIRDAGVLTLVNTMRLDDAGLRQLDALGTVGHVARLGHFHGRDDAFYVDRYAPTMWAFSQAPHERGVETDVELVEGGDTPFAEGQAFRFDTGSVSEGLLLLKRHGGVLLACDSLQNWAEVDEHWDEHSIAVMRPKGFHAGVNVGPGFMARGTPPAADFARLEALTATHLISAHGPPIIGTAQEALAPILQAFRG